MTQNQWLQIKTWSKLYLEAEKRIWTMKHILIYSVALNVVLAWLLGCLWYFDMIGG